MNIKIGSIYNSWKVLNFSHKKKAPFYTCMCLECNNSFIVNGYHLVNGTSKRCSDCGKKASAKSRVGVSRIKDEDSLFRYVRYSFVKSANRRNLAFELSISEVKSLVLSDCYYCGEPPSNACTPMKYSDLAPANASKILVRNGIDRIDSNIGYIVGNVVPCCTTCNVAKLDRNIVDFKNWVEKAYKHLVSKNT